MKMGTFCRNYPESNTSNARSRELFSKSFFLPSYQVSPNIYLFGRKQERLSRFGSIRECEDTCDKHMTHGKPLPPKNCREWDTCRGNKELDEGKFELLCGETGSGCNINTCCKDVAVTITPKPKPEVAQVYNDVQSLTKPEVRKYETYVRAKDQTHHGSQQDTKGRGKHISELYTPF
jgi:hypothetical protein